MSKRKRESSDFGPEEEAPDLHIVVAGRDKPLVAHRGVLRYNSAVVRALPHPADSAPTIWNLRDVVLQDETQPVSADVVQAWLDIVYARVDGSRSGLPPSSLQDCLRLLRFADYAGTCSPVLREAASKFADDRGAFLEVPVNEEHRPRLLLHDSVYYESSYGLEETSTLKEIAVLVLVPETVFDNAAAVRFRIAVSQALESALYLAGRLELLPLITLLRRFVRNQLLSQPPTRAALDFGAVYSPRVLQHLPREVLYEAFLRDGLVDPEARVELKTNTDGSSLEAVLPPRLPAKCFGAVEERVAKVVLQDGKLLRMDNPLAFFRVTALVGGFWPEEREALVREGVARAKEPTSSGGSAAGGGIAST